MVLVGDVGATTTELALLGERLAFREIRSFARREYDSLHHIVRDFLRAGAQAAERVR
jgi:glucokinase